MTLGEKLKKVLEVERLYQEIGVNRYIIDEKILYLVNYISGRFKIEIEVLMKELELVRVTEGKDELN